MRTLIILFIDPDEIDGDRAPRVYRFRKVPPTSRLSKEAWQRASAHAHGIGVGPVKTLVDHRDSARARARARVAATRRADFVRFRGS